MSAARAAPAVAARARTSERASSARAVRRPSVVDRRRSGRSRANDAAATSPSSVAENEGSGDSAWVRNAPTVVTYTFNGENGEECETTWEDGSQAKCVEGGPAKLVEEEFPRSEVERLQKKTLIGMFISYSSAYFVRKPLSVVKAPVKEALGLTTGTMGLIDSAFLLTYALGQFFMPSLGDKIGPKAVIVGGGIISFLCCVAFGYSTVPVVLMGLWAVNGLAQAAAYPLHVKVLNPWFTSKERGTAMGIWATSQQVGATLATFSAAFLLNKVGWKLSIALPASFALVTAALVAVMQLDPPWLQTTTYSSEALQKTKKRADIEPASKQVGFMEILAIPRLKMLMLSYFFVKIVRYCLLFWLPFYLSSEYNMPVAIAGYLSCIYDIGGVLGGLACGIIGDKYFERRRTMLGALSCAGLCFAIAGYQTACGMGMLANAVVMGFIGFLVAGPDAMLGSTAVSDCCEQAGYGQEVLGTAAGIVNGMGSLGAVLQGALTAMIAETYGWGALFVTLAVLSALSVVTMLAATNPKFVDTDELGGNNAPGQLVVA